MQVWKYPIKRFPSFDIEMPAKAAILHVDLQVGEPMMWALVDPKKETEIRSFYIVGTGEDLPDNVRLYWQVGGRRKMVSDYIGTYQLGPYVWHLFEKMD